MALKLKRPKPKDSITLFAEWVSDEFRVPAGINRGKPVVLEPFQIDTVRDYLATEGTSPLYRTTILSTPRKLGKTTLCALIVNGRMCEDSPIFLPGFKGAITAPTEGHAAIVPQYALELLEFVGRNDLHLSYKPKPGALLGPQGGEFRILSGARTQGHGLNLDLAMVDEAGLLSRQNETLQNVFDATAARDGSVFITGTRGDSPIYNDMINNPDDRTSVHLYGADKEDDPSDPETWIKANPGLGSIKSYRYMEDAHGKAEKSGSMTDFNVWNLNMPLSPTRQLLLEYKTLQKSYRDQIEPDPGEVCHVGIDLGGTSSMTAAAVCYESGLIKVLGAFPGGGDLDLVARGKRDLVGTTWLECANRGELVETSGAVTDLAEFLPELVALIGNHPVASVSCDRYRDGEFRTAMARAKIDWPIIFRGTGPKDGDADIRGTRRLFLSGKAKLQRSLLLETSMGERFFEGSAAQRFGVNVMQVTGAPSFPEITGGTGMSWVAEGAGADAAAISTTATNPAIHTATGRYLLTRQAIKQNSALEAILRRDLSEVLREGIDLAVFQGTGADEQPAGFETVLTGGRTAALDDVASFSDFLLRATEIQETAKLSDPAGVRIAGAPIVHQTLADTLISGTAVSELDRLKSAGFGPLWSSQVSARGARDATDKGASTVYFGAGANNAYVPTWGSPELLVDPYSESKTGKVALTMFAFVDVLIQRAATHYFKLTGVQDRA